METGEIFAIETMVYMLKKTLNEAEQELKTENPEYNNIRELIRTLIYVLQNIGEAIE